MRGTVAWFNTTKSFGFIRPDDGGQDYFVHYSSIQMEGFKTLNQGQRVEFDVEVGGPHNKSQAVNVFPLED